MFEPNVGDVVNLIDGMIEPDPDSSRIRVKVTGKRVVSNGTTVFDFVYLEDFSISEQGDSSWAVAKWFEPIKEVMVTSAVNGRHLPGHNTQVYEFAGKSYVDALTKMTDRLSKHEFANQLHIHSVTLNLSDDDPLDEAFLVYLYVDGEL